MNIGKNALVNLNEFVKTENVSITILWGRNNWSNIE